MKTLLTVAGSLTDQTPIEGTFKQWKAKEVTVESDPPQSIQGDGKVWGQTPISIKVVPGAMRLLVPGDSS